MSSCELCGRSMKGRGRSVIIEGASMIVCPQCASKFAEPLTNETKRAASGPKHRPIWAGGFDRPSQTNPPIPKSTQSRKAVSKTRPTGVRLDEMELVENYADVIREARQKQNISQEDLAQRVGERVSTLQAIEAGRQKPVEKTIRGLERELEIALLEVVGGIPIRPTRESKEAGAPTLGDRVVVKRRMSQKARRDDMQTK